MADEVIRVRELTAQELLTSHCDRCGRNGADDRTLGLEAWTWQGPPYDTVGGKTGHVQEWMEIICRFCRAGETRRRRRGRRREIARVTKKQWRSRGPGLQGL